MIRRICMIVAITCVVVPAWAASAAPASAGDTSRQRGAVSGIRADVSCHDPCDDPFWMKAFVKGGSSGLKVSFLVKGRTYTARCDGSGYAHYHLTMRPSVFPQGVVVKVTASVTHGGKTHSASTWFKPNYN